MKCAFRLNLAQLKPRRFRQNPLIQILVAVFCASVASSGGLWANDPTLKTTAGVDIDTSPSKIPVPAVPNDNTILTFEDNFKGPTLDSSKWNKWYPWPVVINRELQNYVLDAFDFLPEGGLRIRADKRACFGQHYTSGSITTYGLFSQAYGYFEMKAKLPKGKGFWPAFWIMPPEGSHDKGGAEIDVLEALMQDPCTVHMTLHSTDPITGKPAGKGQEFKGPDLTEDYHTFAVSWRPNDLVWLVDGIERAHIASAVVPSVPEYLLINMAIGGVWPVPPDATTPFPAYMNVQYVRVYQYKDLAPVPPHQLALGKTTVSPAIVHPGEEIAIQIPVKAGKFDLPPLFARVYVTDFYGKNYLNETDLRLKGVDAGNESVLESKYRIPADLPAGVYTIAVKLECSTDKTIGGFVGCLYRFTVAPRQ